MFENVRILSEDGSSLVGMTTAATDPDTPGDGGVPHGVVGFARSLHGALDRVGLVPVWSMTRGEEREALVALDRAETRLASLRLRVLAQAERDEVGAESGATSSIAWFARETRQTRAACGAAVRMAAAVEGGFTATGRALSVGRVNLDQARVIVAAVNRLSTEHDDLEPGTLERAEAHLLDLASEFDAVVLRRLGMRLFEVVCPEAADAAEGEQLDKDEERARRIASFSMRNNGDGTHEGHFRLPDLHAAVLKKVLESLTAPRRIGDRRCDPKTGKRLPSSVLLGQGLMEFLEGIDPDKLPSQGGSPFTIVVTLGLEALLSGLGAAGLDTGQKISAGQARRLACKASIIPMVLGGRSVPLDLGRERRLYTKHQRIALAHAHGGCAAVNCDRPPDWTEIHHTNPWSKGGRTDLADGIPLCPPHHHMADQPQSWNMKTLPTGGVRFSRRQ